MSGPHIYFSYGSALCTMLAPSRGAWIIEAVKELVLVF